MQIVIPSMGRVGRVKTLRYIPENRLKSVLLAVPTREADQYVETYPQVSVLSVPNRLKGIGHARQYALENATESTLMFIDDDMRICKRLSMYEPTIRDADSKDSEKMFRWMEHSLKSYIHAGISARQGNNRHPTNAERKRDEIEHKIISRMNNIYAYQVDKFLDLGFKFTRLKVMEDFDVTLSLLELGYPNIISYRYCWDQRSSEDTGGCSGYRTSEVQTTAAYKLEKLHRPFVKIVEKVSKDTSTFWKHMKKRTDVNIQWKKAYRSKL